MMFISAKKKTTFSFTRTSSNKKIGPIPSVIVSRSSCPSTCPLFEKGCYALGGPQRLHWNKLETGGLSLKEVCKNISALPHGQVWRYATSGDLVGTDTAIDPMALREIVLANRGKKGYTYTHKPVSGAHGELNQAAIRYANANGFTVNLSANNLVQADEYLALGIAPVCVIVAGDDPAWKTVATPGGAQVVRCPAETRDEVQCANCGGAQGPLCARKDRKFVIGFTVHGNGAKAAAEVARGRSLTVLQ